MGWTFTGPKAEPAHLRRWLPHSSRALWPLLVLLVVTVAAGSLSVRLAQREPTSVGQASQVGNTAVRGCGTASVAEQSLPCPVPGEDEFLASADPAAYSVAVAVAMSRRAFADGGTAEAALASVASFGEALGSSALQGRLNTPLLLTDPQTLSPQTLDELKRLGVRMVHILGGPSAIAPAVAEQLAAAGVATHRHEGLTRVETAVSITHDHFPDAEAAILIRAYGEGDDALTHADALTAGGLAAERKLPILLTNFDHLSGPTRDYLMQSAIKQVIVVGNVGTINANVLQELRDLGIQASGLGGVGDAETAVAVARERGFSSAADADVVLLTEGSRPTIWPAGFAAALHTMRADAPLLLTDGERLPEATRTFLAAGAQSVEIICAPGVTAEACAAARGVAGSGAGSRH